MLLISNLRSTLNASILLIMLLLTILPITYLILSNSLSWVIEINLVNLSSISVVTPILLDNISVIFSITVITISLSVILFSTSYISNENNIEYFTILVILFVLSINILIFIPNILSLLIGWDGLGLTSYLLVIYYSNNNSISAGILTALTNRIGDALLILAVSWAYISGHWNFSYSHYNINILITLIVIIAAITNSAQIPFSAWLPAAIAAPTPVSALVHSSTLVTAGIYLIIRFFPTLNIFYPLNIICFLVGAITCLIASLSAITENDLNNTIALSTLSQLGIIIIALGLEQPLLAFFHLVTHALFNALLFICAGTIIHAENNNQDIRLIGNLESVIPITITMLNTSNISLCGIPFIAGFYSNDSIVETFFITSLPITTSVLLISSVCLTSAYTIRLSYITMWSHNNSQSFTQSCSKFTYCSYLILIWGAIISGASINWVLNPFYFTPTLPTSINILTFSLILSFALIIYILINSNLQNNLIVFISSIWFLTLLSSSLTNNTAINISQTYLYNESTWIENFSGNGISHLILYTSTLAHNTNSIPLSNILTFISLIVTLIASLNICV